jgi:hypothetical protein
VVGRGRNTASLIDQRIFNTMTAFSAHRFKSIGFDTLLMSEYVIQSSSHKSYAANILVLSIGVEERGLMRNMNVLLFPDSYGP